VAIEITHLNGFRFSPKIDEFYDVPGRKYTKGYKFDREADAAV
jgi:hypothetical protein